MLYIMGVLKDVCAKPSGGPPERLPSHTSLILLHALRGIFQPSDFIYPLTARFLLQRPELEINDVPMLYGMLYSRYDDCSLQRGILEVCAAPFCVHSYCLFQIIWRNKEKQQKNGVDISRQMLGV